MRTYSLKRRILLIVLGLTVLSQCVYLYVNVRSFQTSYHDVVQSNLMAIGTSLKSNLDRILAMGISIDKLVGLEALLKDILKDAEELHAVALSDRSGKWMYYCDRERFVNVPSFEDRNGERIVSHLLDNANPLVLPLQGPDHTKTGELHLQMDTGLIRKKIREIALDSATVILISVLAVIDFVFFLIAFTITLPVQGVVQDLDAARHHGSMSMPVRRTGMDFLDRFLDRFDRLRHRIRDEWVQLTTLLSTLSPLEPEAHEADDSAATPLSRLRGSLKRMTTAEEKPTGALSLDSPVLIRPAVFVFIFSEALSISFLPLFAKTLYQPLWNLSQEVVIGLPISAFMLCIAVALPIGGAWSERFGHRKAFVTGAIVSSIGLVLTGLAQDILSLILFRSLVGLGFGIVFMASQNYVVANTTTANRAEGLAMFISAFYAGTLCGSAIGGMLSDRIGFRWIFLLGGGLALLSLAFLYLFLGPKREPDPSGSSDDSSLLWPLKLKGVLPRPRDFRRLFSDRDFLALVLFQNIPNKICLIGFVYYIAPLFLQELGNSRSETGRYIMGYSLAMILFSQGLSRWSDRNQKMKAGIFWGGILSGFVLLPFLLFDNTPMVALGIALLGTAHALSVSNQTKMASQLPSVRSVGMGNGLGIYRLSERLGNVVAPILAGYLVTVMGYAKSLTVLGVYTVISSLLYLLVSKKRAYVRVQISDREPVTCEIDGQGVRLLDLSLGGLSLECGALTPGTTATLTLGLPGLSRPLSVHVDVLTKDPSGVCHCKFRKLSLDVSEAIHTYVLQKAEER